MAGYRSDRRRPGDQSCPAALSVGETLAENAVKIAAELEFAVETRRAQRFIGHSRGMDGHE